MNRDTRHIIKLIFKLLSHRSAFFFWLFVRFVSALFPMLSIYLFSRVIKFLENGTSVTELLRLVGLILFIYIIDNFTRLLSIHKLASLISQTELGIHQFLVIGLSSKDKKIRHSTIQAIRNFGEAVRTTLEIVRQPGVDSFVSIITIPIILFFLDFRIFVIEIAYVALYYFIDVFTTERYSRLKNIQNERTEEYYAKFQDSNRISKESAAYINQFVKMCNWGFIEWFSLQSIAVTFYSFVLLFLSLSVLKGDKQISDLVLIMGYLSSTQVFLNNISTVKDRLTDAKVALLRLADSPYISAVNFSDLT